MSKSEKRQAFKNVGSSWFSLATNVVVGVLLSPFILHHLGDAAFGIWVLIFSITGYYGLFDLGIRSSIVRFVSKYAAVQDSENLARVINTSFGIYSVIGAIAMLVTILGSMYVDSVFRIPTEFFGVARWLLLIVGASVAIGFPLGVFGGILEGLQRFDVLNWTALGATLMRAAFIVVALKHGHGLLMVAIITTGMPLISTLIRAWIAMRQVRVPIGLRYIDKTTARAMANYSGLSFMIIISARLRFQTDEIVLGTMMSAAAITQFSIGARIVDYANDVVHGLAQIFVPLSSQSEAKGDMARLRKMLVVGNRACAFVILPITAVLILLGKALIEVWVGPRYVTQSYPVLVVLVLPFTLLLGQAASGRILIGTGKHRTFGIITLIEGFANVVLSVLLVRPLGVLGDAIGTAIPLTCTMLVFMPRHICRVLGVPVWTYLKHAYTLPIVVCTPMVISLFLMRRWFVPHRFLPLLLHLTVAGAVYGAGLLWLYLKDHAFRLDEAIALGTPVFAETNALRD